MTLPVAVIALIAGFVPVMNVPVLVPLPDASSNEHSGVYEISNKKIPLLEYLLFYSTPAEIVAPPTAEPVPRQLSIQGQVYDDKLGYGFEYPGGWELFVGEDNFADQSIIKIVTFQKEEKSKDGIVVSANIEFMVKSVPDFEIFKNELKQHLKDSGVSIIEEGTISANNLEGYDLLSGSSTWKLRQVVFYVDKTAYIFKFSSQEALYLMYEDTFNRIIHSFYIQ